MNAPWKALAQRIRLELPTGPLKHRWVRFTKINDAEALAKLEAYINNSHSLGKSRQEMIQTVLHQKFADEELRCLCYDWPEFQLVYEQLTPQSNKAEVITHQAVKTAPGGLSAVMSAVRLISRRSLRGQKSTPSA